MGVQVLGASFFPRTGTSAAGVTFFPDQVALFIHAAHCARLPLSSRASFRCRLSIDAAALVFHITAAVKED